MEKCKNCEIIHNGSIIKVSEDGRCIFCGRKVGSSVPNNTKKEEKNKEEECKYCDSHDLKCPKNSSPQSPLSEQTECPKCKRRSDFVDMKDCPFCDPEYKPLTLNPLIKNRSLEDEIPEIARGLKEVSEIMKHKEVTKTTKVPQSPLGDERCIQCKLEGNDGKCDRKDCSGYNFSSSNEDWEKEFDDRFELESQGCSECGGFELVDRREERYPKGKYHCEYDLEKIKDFILQQRLAAQRSLAEEIIKQLGEEPKIIDGIKTGMMAWTREGIIDFLTARGLLPKITE